MLPNDPSRVSGSPSFRPAIRGCRKPPQSTGPAFPRSGWNDQNSLSSSLREAILRMRHDYSDYFNWRRPSNPPVSAHPPMNMPMYGMPNPGGGDNGGVKPPIFAPMYGMPNPGGGDNGGGNPPIFAPMYGMPNP